MTLVPEDVDATSGEGSWMSGLGCTRGQAPHKPASALGGVDDQRGIAPSRGWIPGETSGPWHPSDVPDETVDGGPHRDLTPRGAHEIVGAAAASMPTPTGPVQGPAPPPTRSAATALLLLYGASVTGGRDALERSGAGIMIRWEYAHLSAGFDGVTQQWTVTMRVPGREIESGR